MPLGLLSLAANLQQENLTVKIYKPKIRLLNQTNFKQAATDILLYKPLIIGFSTWCISYPAAILLAEEIKKTASRISIIFGGPHASSLSLETLTAFPFVDYVLSGESDYTFPQFVREIKKSKSRFWDIQGLNFRVNSKVIQNKIKTTITDLDKLPIPAYHLVAQTKWLKIDVGRGCPFHCTYCSTSLFFSKKYRIKTAERIYSEMIQAWQKRKITSFSFAHDMFTLDKKFVFELCEKLIEFQKSKQIKFKWNCSARIDCVNKEMLSIMKDAGCSDIFFGIETGSERLQKKIKKNLPVSEVNNIAMICRTIGIRMHASFILGFPGENKTDFNQTLRSVIQLAINGALTQASELSLLPGTPLFKKHKSELKFDGRFSNFSRNFCGKEETELIKNFPNLFSSFYYLPAKIFNRTEMLFLRLFINNSKDFRNTLYLLSEFIEADLKEADLVSRFKKEIKKLNINISDPASISLKWIEVLDHYITKNVSKICQKHVRDVFEYESYAAILLKLYSTSKTFPGKKEKQIFQNEFTISPTPVWKVITVNYKLEKIIPSENGWEKNPKGIRKKNYSYLIIAESVTRCKIINIDATDLYLLNALSNCLFTEYLKKIDGSDSKNNILKWLIRMQKLGVIEFMQQKNHQKKEPRFTESV